MIEFITALPDYNAHCLQTFRLACQGGRHPAYHVCLIKPFERRHVNSAFCDLFSEVQLLGLREAKPSEHVSYIRDGICCCRRSKIVFFRNDVCGC